MSVFFLETAARKCPYHTAIKLPSEQITYSELLIQVTQIAGSLKCLGIKKGTKVVLLSDTSLDFLVMLLAIFRLGAIAAPLNTRLHTSEWEQQLDLIEAEWIWASDSYKSRVSSRLNTKCLDFTRLSTPQDPVSLPEYPGENQPATLIFTSGTSGQPKAVLHLLSAHLWSAKGSNTNICLNETDRWLLSLPLFHVGGLSILFRSLLAGAAVVVPDPKLSFTENLVKLNFSHVSMVSTQLYRCLSYPDTLKKLTPLKAILLGGSAVAANLIERSLDHNLRIFCSYGSTEMASQITTTQSIDKDDLATSGFLLPYRELRLSEEGEILVKGKTLFHQLIQTSDAGSSCDKDGWYATGDLGCFDEKNRLVVLGRKDNLFISGGENIQPEEVEQAIKNCNQVIEAVVVPVPHPEFGYRPFAFVAMQPDVELNSDQLKGELSETIARYKIPDTILTMPDELFGVSIKPNRNKAKALAIRLSQSNTHK